MQTQSGVITLPEDQCHSYREFSPGNKPHSACQVWHYYMTSDLSAMAESHNYSRIYNSEHFNTMHILSFECVRVLFALLFAESGSWRHSSKGIIMKLSLQTRAKAHGMLHWVQKLLSVPARCTTALAHSALLIHTLKSQLSNGSNVLVLRRLLLFELI